MASADMFLKLDGIKGESQDDKHKGEIHIESFSWGANQEAVGGTGGGSGAGKVRIDDIQIVKRVDKSSPLLFQHCASGKHIKDGLITVRKAGENPVEYLKIKLTEVLVSHFSHTGGGETALPAEHVTLNFSKIEWEYQEQKADGTKEGGPVTCGWDVKANKKV